VLRRKRQERWEIKGVKAPNLGKDFCKMVLSAIKKWVKKTTKEGKGEYQRPCIEETVVAERQNGG